MTRAQSRVRTRRSLFVGIFSLLVAVLLGAIAVAWVVYATPVTSIIWIVLALIELVIGIAMVRPLRFRVTVTDQGISNEGHNAWSLDRSQIDSAGVMLGKHPTLWARPANYEKNLKIHGYTDAPVAPRGAYLAPISASSVTEIAQAISAIGLTDGLDTRPPLTQRASDAISQNENRDDQAAAQETDLASAHETAQSVASEAAAQQAAEQTTADQTESEQAVATQQAAMEAGSTETGSDEGSTVESPAEPSVTPSYTPRYAAAMDSFDDDEDNQPTRPMRAIRDDDTLDAILAEEEQHTPTRGQ